MHPPHVHLFLCSTIDCWCSVFNREVNVSSLRGRFYRYYRDRLITKPYSKLTQTFQLMRLICFASGAVHVCSLTPLQRQVLQNPQYPYFPRPCCQLTTLHCRERVKAIKRVACVANGNIPLNGDEAETGQGHTDHHISPHH